MNIKKEIVNSKTRKLNTNWTFDTETTIYKHTPRHCYE